LYHFNYQAAWRGRSAEEYIHTALGSTLAYLIDIAIAPHLGGEFGNAVTFNVWVLLLLIVVTVGVTWILDKLHVGTAIPGKWEYIIICAVAVAVYNILATATYPALSLVDIIYPPITPDYFSIIRGAIFGGLGGFFIAAAQGLKFHGGKGK